MAVTKHAWVIDHLKKTKTGRYAKTVFYLLLTNPMNSASITVTRKRVSFGDGQSLQIPCTILLKEKEKYIEKTVELVPFIIVCTTETLSGKYEEHQNYH